MLLVSTYVASVIEEVLNEVRAQRLQMHVNLGSVRCLSAAYRLLIGFLSAPMGNSSTLGRCFITPITTPFFGQKTRGYPQ